MGTNWSGYIAEKTAVKLPLMILLMALTGCCCADDLSPKAIAKGLKNRARWALQESELVKSFGGENSVQQGAGARLEDTTSAFCIRPPKGSRKVSIVYEPAPSAITDLYSIETKKVKLCDLQPIGESGLFLGAKELPEGTAVRFWYEVDGNIFGSARTLEAYTFPPESKENPLVPKGTLIQMSSLISETFGGTSHDWWIYKPNLTNADQECNLIVFQDGQWAKNYVPTYLDNLIAQGDIAPTVAVFITPGTFPDKRSDRSREYDTLDDKFSSFLIGEILPKVENQVKLSHDPMKRCVAGLSSGGICAFTVAWQRPDQFGLVMTWIGSFTNIASGTSKQEGGHNYPALIRKTDKKAIRVFLQEGSNDLNNEHGNWPLGNLAMIKSLQFKNYDLLVEWGQGFHSDQHGRATLSKALKWLFGKH